MTIKVSFLAPFRFTVVWPDHLNYYQLFIGGLAYVRRFTCYLDPPPLFFVHFLHVMRNVSA